MQHAHRHVEETERNCSARGAIVRAAPWMAWAPMMTPEERRHSSVELEAWMSAEARRRAAQSASARHEDQTRTGLFTPLAAERRGARLFSKLTRRRLIWRLDDSANGEASVGFPDNSSTTEKSGSGGGRLGRVREKIPEVPGSLASAGGGEAGVGEPLAAWSSGGLQAPARGSPPLRRGHSGKGALAAAARGQRSGAVAAGITSCVMREQATAVRWSALLTVGEINTRHWRGGAAGRPAPEAAVSM